MSDSLQAELGKMLDNYDAARLATENGQRQAIADEAQFLRRFADLRRDVVRPVFEAAGAILAQRGHAFRISEEEYAIGAAGKSTEAGIAIHVLPAGMSPTLQVDDPLRSLSIATRHYNKNVSIIGGAAAVPGGLAGSRGAYELSQISTALVEAELLKLIAGILKG
jgi:hypothetical protein